MDRQGYTPPMKFLGLLQITPSINGAACTLRQRKLKAPYSSMPLEAYGSQLHSFPIIGRSEEPASSPSLQVPTSALDWRFRSWQVMNGFKATHNRNEMLTYPVPELYHF
ncbi:hypothetical protein LENED_012775 [Lentinula edodes]|uniref:Uncharacterized protein n=1 Tax=Lentinula edodes TaxID=5353 RepID=A0A1Q3ETI4_LENED|nr:hypothetical protein LENED_012775 [Lentinula edodes]